MAQLQEQDQSNSVQKEYDPSTYIRIALNVFSSGLGKAKEI